MDTGRKLMKFFESIRLYPELMKALKNPTISQVAVINKLSIFLYWAFENMLVLCRLNLLPLNISWIAKFATWIEVVFYVTSMMLKIRAIKATGEELGKMQELIEENKSIDRTQLIKLEAKNKLLHLMIVHETCDNLWLLKLLFKSSIELNSLIAIGNFLAICNAFLINLKN